MKLNTGLALLIAAACCGVLAAQEYEGPSVLSRSGGGLRPYGARLGEDAKMRLFAQAEAIYDYGFLPIATNSLGSVSKIGGQFGVEGRVGIYGTKRWRRSSLGLDYTGSYTAYEKVTYFNGSDNFLGLEYGNQVDRATMVTGTLTAGTSSRVFSFADSLIGSPLGNILPTSDIFDARTYFLNGGMGLSHQITSRLGFELHGDAFRIERHSASLVSAQGYSPKASLAYRLNRRSTIGAIYNFFHYDYPRFFGETNAHVFMGYWSYEINRGWRFEIQGGAFVADNSGTRTVAADPIVQQLLGVPTISEAYSRVLTLPSGQVQLTGKTGNSRFSFTAFRGVGAGNGITQAATEQTGALNYYYVVSKNIELTLRASYTGTVGLGTDSSRYTTVSSGFSAAYNTPNFLSYSFHGEYRHSITSTNQAFNFDSFQIGLGLGWNLRDVPFIH